MSGERLLPEITLEQCESIATIFRLDEQVKEKEFANKLVFKSFARLLSLSSSQFVKNVPISKRNKKKKYRIIEF